MINIDANIKNADWPKRTPDKFEDLVQKYDPDQARDKRGRFAETAEAKRKAANRAADAALFDAKPVELSHNTSAAEMKARPLPKTLAEAEDRIRYEQKEHVFLIKEGTPFKTLGNDDSHHVRMNDATPEDLKDAVLTHNHPSGFGLSNQDAVTAAKRNLLEMRAVTATGTHSIRRTSTDWPSHFDESISDMHQELMTELGLRIHDNDISVSEANTLHHRLMYTRLQERVGGFIYSFEPKV